MLCATIYDLCCSKTLLPWTIFELGDDRKSLHEFYYHFQEVQMSCNLGLIKKNPPARLREKTIPMQDGKQEIYLEWPYV